jgi:hypothetical protein
MLSVIKFSDQFRIKKVCIEGHCCLITLTAISIVPSFAGELRRP